MRYLWGTLAVLIFVAAATGFLCYHFSSEPALHAAAKKGDAMAWLRADFHLDDRQFAAVKKLHDAYTPTCAEHCRLIKEARHALKVAAGAGPAVESAAERALQELRLTCETAITVHVRQVAAVMSPAEGERYLALVRPKIANFDHTAAPDLQLNHLH